jgi:hypothetical protein
MLFSASSLAEARITCCTRFSTCHDFLTRSFQQHQLRLSFAPMNWKFQVAHCGLVLSFSIVFSFHSTIFDGVIYFVEVLVLIAIVVLQTLIIPFRVSCRKAQKVYAAGIKLVKFAQSPILSRVIGERQFRLTQLNGMIKLAACDVTVRYYNSRSFVYSNF